MRPNTREALMHAEQFCEKKGSLVSTRGTGRHWHRSGRSLPCTFYSMNSSSPHMPSISRQTQLGNLRSRSLPCSHFFTAQPQGALLAFSRTGLTWPSCACKYSEALALLPLQQAQRPRQHPSSIRSAPAFCPCTCQRAHECFDIVCVLPDVSWNAWAQGFADALARIVRSEVLCPANPSWRLAAWLQAFAANRYQMRLLQYAYKALQAHARPLSVTAFLCEFAPCMRGMCANMALAALAFRRNDVICLGMLNPSKDTDTELLACQRVSKGCSRVRVPGFYSSCHRRLFRSALSNTSNPFTPTFFRILHCSICVKHPQPPKKLCPHWRMRSFFFAVFNDPFVL